MPRGNGIGSPRKGGQGRGRMGGYAQGPGGRCVCPNCGEKVRHISGQPCYENKCPKCSTAMARER